MDLKRDTKSLSFSKIHSLKWRFLPVQAGFFSVIGSSILMNVMITGKKNKQLLLIYFHNVLRLPNEIPLPLRGIGMTGLSGKRGSGDGRNSILLLQGVFYRPSPLPIEYSPLSFRTTLRRKWEGVVRNLLIVRCNLSLVSRPSGRTCPYGQAGNLISFTGRQ